MTDEVHEALGKHVAAVVFISAGVILLAALGIHALSGRCDGTLSILINAAAHRSWFVDRIVVFLSENPLVKGFPALAIFFYAWFQPGRTSEGAQLSKKHQILLYTLFILPFAIVLARVLAGISPYRVRPIDNPDLHLRIAYAFDPASLPHWSSFLSDHAVFFFTLATGVALACRRAGILLFLHALIIIVLPRLYLGIHYPSDLLSGAALGCAIGYLANWPGLRSLVASPGIRLHQYSAPIFYAVLFYIAAETAVLYDHLLNAAIHISQLVHSIVHHVKH
jgi:undecaprenyl-diphosphatase